MRWIKWITQKKRLSGQNINLVRINKMDEIVKTAGIDNQVMKFKNIIRNVLKVHKLDNVCRIKWIKWIKVLSSYKNG